MPDDQTLDPAQMTEAYTGPGKLVGADKFEGMPNEQAKQPWLSTLRKKV
ncbi:MAG: hypothetical protein LRY50_06280 [Geovibrio sp.]|nr:hypothetical protein [Geovibrio sp.]